MHAETGEAIAERVRTRHALDGSLSRFAAGSLPVYRIGGYALKLFPAAEYAHFLNEREVLSHVHESLPLSTPLVVTSGEQDGWSYLLMTLVQGQPLADAWTDIPALERHRLMHEAGSAIRALHRSSTAGLTIAATDWHAFIDDQRRSCVKRQEARGLATPWLDAIDPFLTQWCAQRSSPHVLLHTEIMREHLFVDVVNGQWKLSGLVDFEPATVGDAEYEFAAVGVYLTGGDRSLLSSVVAGYGACIDEGFPQRVMAFLLLHRYSNLQRYLAMLPFDGDAGDLNALARAWFSPS